MLASRVESQLECRRLGAGFGADLSIHPPSCLSVLVSAVFLYLFAFLPVCQSLCPALCPLACCMLCGCLSAAMGTHESPYLLGYERAPANLAVCLPLAHP